MIEQEIDYEHKLFNDFNDDAPVGKAFKIALQALQDIVDPIGHIKRDMQPGDRLNGSFANAFANDPNCLKGIARTALREIAWAWPEEAHRILNAPERDAETRT